LSDKLIAPRPFLRWVGGKRHLIGRLLNLLPEDVRERTYHEPFLGAGALFFALQPNRAVLGDANAQLIDCYLAIRQTPGLVARYVAHHARAHGKRYYYMVRSAYNRGGAPAAQAARFIYLNSACFNGVFRVNTAGEFNVPIGRKKCPLLPTPHGLRQIARLLRGARLEAAWYDTVLGEAGPASFVYLDPPYPPLNGTSNFTHYTLDRFTPEDQRSLSAHVAALDKRGARFLMTNADTPLVREQYKQFAITPLQVTRWVSCKAERYRVNELAITNYLIRG
jgi:DNA adenine methylase